jgi:chromosome segregation protein
MRLTKIKLAGFKSFVDPTTVVLPSQLVGIVGPNGCGKSNTIDCVRWVMGESSAKHLRGESMVDVIFNGSASRKPVSQASVELIFDNRDGSLGGQYAAYSEIAVKRVINRDAQSAYYLNGTRCRRRDIMDVFLGTGLGPRSYAIIEQGMISRVVEAKPEELRTYLEEAAGISLYKERRKETERRISGTRENLNRLNDLRDEVGQQLEKLKRQAETAERYKALKAEERARRGELIALRMRALDDELGALEQQLEDRMTAVEAAVARQREIERDIELTRERYTESTDTVNDVQGRFYAIGSDIARIEQQISHQRELKDKQHKELSRIQETLRELETGIAQDEEKLAVLSQRLEEIEPELEAAREGEEEANERLAESQEALDGWQERWEQFNQDAAEPVRIAQVERTRIEGLERRSQELSRRRERLGNERSAVQLDALEAEIEALAEQEGGLREEVEVLAEQAEALQERLAELREAADARRDELDEAKGELQAEQGRLRSLETLQQAALGADGPLADWLAERGWQDNTRLAQLLSVEPGWERALEAVLGGALQAVCVDELAAAEAQLKTLARGELTLLAGGASIRESKGELLLSKVQGPGPLADLLLGVHCVEDLAAAQRVREQLKSGESVVTRDGLWLGRSWARVRAGDDGQSGVLAREREIAALREHIESLQVRIRELADALEEGEEALGECQEQLDERQDERNELNRRLATLHAQLEGRRSRLHEHRQRRERLDDEIAEVGQELARSEAEVREARGRLQTALEQSEEFEARRESLQRERFDLQERGSEYRHQLRQHRERRHELSLKIESAVSARRSIQDALTRMQTQHARTNERRAELEAALAELEDPGAGLAQEREYLLSRRIEVEAQLSAARSAMAENENRLRELERARTDADRRAQEVREGLEGGRLKAQELTVRRQGEAERLSELGQEYAELLRTLPAEAAEGEWQAQLERLESRIARLGPINLAAIEEYEALQERAGYLEHQYNDLMEALETLENAIRKIDRETRSRFKATYDKVNAGMQKIFPRLFGGGEGRLELTGEDLLETGVTIMARPPGKRITNIHLLSGGEKALTAVALVFAIFELNPSPFCMLDEVDAPLDEANVGRFCEMLIEMSPRVQFIFITHNKVTMQIAEHLQGVTMHEPGVSRLVAVDVDEAVRLAAV